MRVRFQGFVLIAAWLLQGCGVLTLGTSQKIPLTCTPPGAVVHVDGVRVGVAPTVLRLKKTRDHTVRITKDGYDPLVVDLVREPVPGRGDRFEGRLGGRTGFIICDIALGAVGGGLIGGGLGLVLRNGSHGSSPVAGSVFWAGVVAVPIIALAWDSASQPWNRFSPATLELVLRKSDGGPIVRYVRLDRGSARWIRIVCRDLINSD